MDTSYDMVIGKMTPTEEKNDLIRFRNRMKKAIKRETINEASKPNTEKNIKQSAL